MLGRSYVCVIINKYNKVVSLLLEMYTEINLNGNTHCNTAI